MIPRILEAWRILVRGTRPASLRYDAIEQQIASCCAAMAADKIAGEMEELPDYDADHTRFLRIFEHVEKSIEFFVKYPKLWEEELRVKRKPPRKDAENIPF